MQDMMERRWTPLVLGCLLVLCAVFQTSHSEESVGSLEDVIFSSDQTRLQQVLAGAQPYHTFEEAYLVAKGVHELGDTISNRPLVQSACQYVLAGKMETIEDIFHLVSVGILFKDVCKVSSNSPVRSKVEKVLQGTPDMKTLYYAITAAVDLKIDQVLENKTDALLAAVMETVEKEDTPQSYAYAFLAAAVIPNVDLSPVFETIEDIVAQADETPSTLYFEGGLGVTADVVSGIFALADRMKAAPAITEAQATKFGNFLVTSKYTSSLTDAVHLLTAARALSSNNYVVPTAITLPNSQPISSSNPDLAVQLTTLMGGVVEGFTPKVKSLEDPEGEVNPRTRTMTAGNDKISFSYPMFKDTTGPGQYKVTISTGAVEKSPSPVVELSGAELSVMVSFQVAIGSAKLSIVDKDQGVTTKSASLEYPNTSTTSMQADQHSKLVMVFTLTDKEKSKPITVHQAFVRLSLRKEEIFFVATPNAEKQYSFELDVADSAKDFGQLSGTYLLSLMVGDFALENPFSWDVASVELKFPGTPGSMEENMAYKPKKLIEHLFRVPEKRPPKVVSTAFTVLVFIPLALLVVIWLAMGANFSNFSTGGIWAILFHTGLGAILGLYYCFWAQLNMFSTLKYLFFIGVFTFLTGNRMLRNIAKARES